MDSCILIVDDSPETIHLMGRILSSVGRLRFATSGAEALAMAKRTPPDLILLDAQMPGMNGFQLCKALRRDPVLQLIPVIFVTAHNGPQIELECLEAGAVDFIAKPISEALLVARVRTQLRVKILTEKLWMLAATDALTELVNRRGFDEALARGWKRGLREGDPISLLMIDVDHFKLFNDRYGHPAGDVCLRTVAQALQSATRRPADVVARHGGEEFAMLLPQTSRQGAEVLAARVLHSIDALRMPHEGSATARHVTVSIGVGCYGEDSSAWVGSPTDSRLFGTMPVGIDDLVSSADKALYAAKSNGRGRADFQRLDGGDGTMVARPSERPRPPAAARTAQ